jgi:hypothetical protein
MRETRLSGSEGGEAELHRPSLPLSRRQPLQAALMRGPLPLPGRVQPMFRIHLRVYRWQRRAFTLIELLVVDVP